MPRTPKKTDENEDRTQELGILALVSSTGKTVWQIVTQSVGSESGRVYDHEPLREEVTDKDGHTHTVTIEPPSKAGAQWFLKGYTYAMSEVSEREQ